jgi:hypothetical protein
MQRLAIGAAFFAQPRFNASSTPAAKIKPLSDTLSLLDAVPFLACPCVWLRAGFLHRNR